MRVTKSSLISRQHRLRYHRWYHSFHHLAQCSARVGQDFSATPASRMARSQGTLRCWGHDQEPIQRRQSHYYGALPSMASKAALWQQAILAIYSRGNPASLGGSRNGQRRRQCCRRAQTKGARRDAKGSRPDGHPRSGDSFGPLEL